MSASKVFEYENGGASLKYSASLNPNGVIDEFDISLDVSSDKEGPPDFLARIIVEDITIWTNVFTISLKICDSVI